MKKTSFLTISLFVLLKQANVQHSKIEAVSFEKNSFLDENGDYKYEIDEENLPWNDHHKMMVSLSNTHQLIYNFANLIRGRKTFENKTLTAEVSVNIIKSKLNIDYIFHAYDRYNLPDNLVFPSNHLDFRHNNRIYPFKNLFIRIADKKTIITRAGTFKCTVLEGYNNMSDESYKLWMVDDQPGIYARIIVSKAGQLGHYHIFELINIK